MKRLLPLVLALPTIAHAWDFEAGIGASQFSTKEDGLWYQEGFPHRLDLRSASVTLGITGDVLPWLAWRAAYVYLGNVESSALAAPDATDYADGVGGYNPSTKRCNGTCGPMRRFEGRGHLQGAYLTLEPHVSFRGFRFAIEGGPFLSLAKWKATAYTDGRQTPWAPVEDFNYKPRVEFGTVLGASIGRGNLSLSYQLFRMHSSPSYAPPIWHSVQLVSVRYRF